MFISFPYKTVTNLLSLRLADKSVFNGILVGSIPEKVNKEAVCNEILFTVGNNSPPAGLEPDLAEQTSASPTELLDSLSYKPCIH